jgi:hypothetical protein
MTHRDERSSKADADQAAAQTTTRNSPADTAAVNPTTVQETTNAPETENPTTTGTTTPAGENYKFDAIENPYHTMSSPENIVEATDLTREEFFGDHDDSNYADADTVWASHESYRNMRNALSDSEWEKVADTPPPHIDRVLKRFGMGLDEFNDLTSILNVPTKLITFNASEEDLIQGMENSDLDKNVKPVTGNPENEWTSFRTLAKFPLGKNTDYTVDRPYYVQIKDNKVLSTHLDRVPEDIVEPVHKVWQDTLEGELDSWAETDEYVGHAAKLYGDSTPCTTDLKRYLAEKPLALESNNKYDGDIMAVLETTDLTGWGEGTATVEAIYDDHDVRTNSEQI